MVNDSTDSGNKLPTDRLWKINEVAEYLRVSEQTVRNRIDDSGLPYKRFGGALRFDRAEIDAWLEGSAAA